VAGRADRDRRGRSGAEIAVWDNNPEQRYSQEELAGILDKAVNGLAPPYRPSS
jgi:hypothetical protein